MKKIIKILLIIFLSSIIIISSSVNVQAAQQDSGDGGGSTEEVVTPEEITGGASNFVDAGKDKENPLNYDGLQNVSSVVYNILLAVGIITAVIIGMFIGIKYMTGSVSEKAETKQLIMPYIVGCVVVFGAFTIWNIVVGLINQTQ